MVVTGVVLVITGETRMNRCEPSCMFAAGPVPVDAKATALAAMYGLMVPVLKQSTRKVTESPLLADVRSGVAWQPRIVSGIVMVDDERFLMSLLVVRLMK